MRTTALPGWYNRQKKRKLPEKQLRRRPRQKQRQHRNRAKKRTPILKITKKIPMIQRSQEIHIQRRNRQKIQFQKILIAKTVILLMKKAQTAVKIHLTVLHQMTASHLQRAQTPVRENNLGNFTLTAYCNCAQCCGTAGNLTASGTVPTAGRTVAMAGVPFGTQLLINGNVYTVEDLGTPYGHVDIFFNNHSDALSFGLQSAEVYQLN